MKAVEYEINVGSGSTEGTIYVDDNATDDEIRLAILDDLYEFDYRVI